MENAVWANGLPRMTQELYDRFIEIQGMRNAALRGCSPEHRAATLPSEVNRVNQQMLDALNGVHEANLDLCFCLDTKGRGLGQCVWCDARDAIKAGERALLGKSPVSDGASMALGCSGMSPELRAMIENARYHKMTLAEQYEQRRSFVRGMCPSNRDFDEWCKQVDKLLPPQTSGEPRDENAT